MISSGTFCGFKPPLRREMIVGFGLDQAIAYCLYNHWNVRVVLDKKKALIDGREYNTFISLVADDKGKVTDYYYG